jgi:glycosyltransferase involved in cell wall biosynthesis
MRIVIDMQGAQSDSRYRGIGRYTLSFVRALLEEGKDHEFYLVLNGDLPASIERIRDDFNDLIPQSRIRMWYQPQPGAAREAQNGWRRRASELIREALILSLSPDVVHIPSFFEGYVDSSVMSLEWIRESGVKVSITLHDLIPLVKPAQYLDPDPKYGKFYLSQLDQFSKASLLLGVSDFSCKQAIEYLDLDPSIVVNTSSAISSECFFLSSNTDKTQEVLSHFALKNDFILCVGGGDPRKNLLGLVQAYAMLDIQIREAIDLVLIGPNLHEYEIQSRSPSDSIGHIHVLGHISDDDLRALYQVCKIFVFPSLYEGFGLPPLEAMSCGAPVISSDSTSLPEVVGLEEALFDASSPQIMSNKMKDVLTNESLRLRLIEHGKHQAKQFSFSKTGKKALEAMNALIVSYSPSQKKKSETVKNVIYQKLIAKISTIPRSEGAPNQNDLILCAKAIADTFPQKPSLPRIFVDISELAQRDSKTGIQRVTRSILYELLVNPPEGYQIEPIYGTIEKIGYKLARSFTRQLLNSADPVGEDDFIDPQDGDIFLGLDLQHHTTRVQAEYLQGMRRAGVLVYFVVYDLLPIQFPHFWPAEHRVDKVHEEWLTVVCQGDGALCISKAVADELGKWMKKTLPPKPNFQISWFHLGANLQGSLPTFGLPDDAPSVLSALAARKSFLLVGTIEPRKGYAQVLDAFELLWSNGADVNLVIVGKIGWVAEGLVNKLENHVELGKRLFWLKGVSDEYLDRIYQSSSCLIAASEGEGFGLPLIEAAQHGIPIIARDLPVFKEVASSGAYYFVGLQDSDLSGAIQKWIALDDQGKAPSSAKVSSLTWSESAQMISSRLFEMRDQH